MPISFLGSVVQQLKAQNLNWENLCFVLPNKRACLFLQQELAQAFEGPQILPEMMSIDDFVSSISARTPANELQQQQALYKSYCATLNTKNPDSFETFLGWSSTLLKDINTMDQYLLDREAFFYYLKSLHKMRSWGKEEDKIIQNYTAFWEQLPQMYQGFSAQLELNGSASIGMCYRAATELLENFIDHKKATQFIFCGFNALSPSEEKIVQELLAQGKAQIFWDIDKQMLDKRAHQAGLFIRKYISEWPYYRKNPFEQAHDAFQQPKKIQVIEVQQQVGQAKQLGALLAAMNRSDDWSNTAVVLADESLLLPLLYALPNNIDELNITMGFPLELHPLSLFVSAFMKMELRRTSHGYYYADLETLMSLPETQALFASLDPTFCTTLLNRAKKQHRSYLTTEYILETAPKPVRIPARYLFAEEDRTPEQWIDALIALLRMFYDTQQTKPLVHVYSITVEKLLELFSQTKDILKDLGKPSSFPLLQSLYRQLIAGQKLDFVGAPLRGLQIMGVLETRAIDFDRVLIAGVNEGILPAQGTSSSWIPYDVKKEFGLPTQEEQDAIFTYHFYRLMYRVKDVVLLYNGTTDGIQVGEPSRFVRQWEFERPSTHTWAEYIQEAVFIPPENAPKTAPKTKAAMQKLIALCEKGFSPSALNLYVKDSYAFYKRYLLELKDEDELEEFFSHRTYGTLVHNILEALYTPYIGKTLSVADCKQMISNTDSVTDKIVLRIFPSGISGKNILAVAAIKRNIQNIIREEKEQILNGNIIELIALEQELSMTRTYDFVQEPIKIKGTVDRIDAYNGKLRVLDYKTGSVKKGKLGIMDWSSVALDPDSGQTRQLLLYALLWNSTHPNKFTKHAGIIALKEYQKGVLYVGEKATVRAQIDHELTPEKMQQAAQTLEELLRYIFDEKRPFIETKD